MNARPSAAGYQLVLVRPRGFPFVEGFREIMESLREGFAALGIPCRLQTNRIAGDATPIIFGAHHLAPEEADRLPPASIIYNLEQLIDGYPWFTDNYLALLRRFVVWDFSPANLVRLRGLGIADARHMPIGYAACLAAIPAIEEDIDLLFYGMVTPHRQAILAELQAAGMGVVVLAGLYGAERDAWIARARVVLNLHAAPGGLFEAPRVCHLLANRKAVVSECAHPEEMDADLKDGVAAVPAAGIADACRRLLADAASRESLAAEGHRRMTAPARHIANLLRHVIDTAHPETPTSAIAKP